MAMTYMTKMSVTKPRTFSRNKLDIELRRRLSSRIYYYLHYTSPLRGEVDYLHVLFCRSPNNCWKTGSMLVPHNNELMVYCPYQVCKSGTLTRRDKMDKIRSTAWQVFGNAAHKLRWMRDFFPIRQAIRHDMQKRVPRDDCGT